MINCYPRSFKYIFNVQSLINLLVKGFFTSVNSKVFPKNFVAIIFIAAMILLPVLGYGQTLTFSSSNPAVPASTIGQGSTNQIIYQGSFVENVNWGVNITNLSFTPSGTFVPSDISSYKFWTNTTNSFSTASLSYPTVASLSSGTTVSMSVNNPWFAVGQTCYFWITADINTNSTVGHTLNVGALTSSNFTFNPGVATSGTMYAGGTQTIASQQQFNSSGTFIVPNDVYSLDVACWGGGAGGNGSTNPGHGGGGGAFAGNNALSVTPGSTYTVTIGAGGGANGQSSSFGSSVVAAGAIGATGGSVASSIGTVLYAGGTGGSSTGRGGAGGGGSAGAGGNGGIGGNATNNSGGIAGVAGAAASFRYPGAAGGAGGDRYNNGNPGVFPGGGGGEGSNGYIDGSGAAGQVIITWMPSYIIASTTALGGFNYIYDFGPSALQSFTVSGDRLPADITITAPAHYEMSVDGGVTFISTSVTVNKSSNTTVYVRLKAALAVGSYNAESITLSSAAITKNITCSGFVSAAPPSIVAAGGIDCSTNVINLKSTYSSGVSNVYWTGPNNYYSTTQNPTITGATSVNEGIYTVTGSVLSGVNLITNGDFGAGNTGFTSEYTNWPLGTSGDMSESRYSVVTSPFSIHSNFCSGCGDHTSGTGNQMVINGAGAEKTIWSPAQAIVVTPNTNYQFIYWVQTVVKPSDPSPSKLQLYANGVAAGLVYTANAATGVWTQFIYNWNSGSNTTVNLQLKNENFASGGNDFALDDISFQPVVQISSSVKVTLAKNPSLLLVAAAANPVAAGTNVTFSTIPTNGGTAPTFQWYVNGSLVVGATNPTYSYVPLNNDNVTCVMTPVGACVSTPVTSNPIVIMTVNPTPNYWVGTTSTSWSVPANWSAGVVPKPGDDVIFATAGNNGGNAAQNDLYVDTNHSIGNLVNQTTDRKLVVTPAKILVVNQKITTNSPDQILIQSAFNQPNGSLIFPQSTTANATVEMYSKATHNNTGITVGSNTYFYTWQYFGIPLTSVVASPTFDGSFVRKNDETSSNTLGKWTSLVNADVLDPFKGYEITQDAPTKIVFRGTLVNADKSIDLAYTSTAYDPGQNMLANPYTAAIDIRQLTFASATTVENAVYLYNTGSFGQWSNNNGETTYDTGTNLAGQYIAIPQSAAGTGSIPYDIPSMSAFMVKAISGPVSGGVKINYSSVITKNVNPQRAQQSKVSSDKVYLEVSLRGEHYGDRMWLINEPGTTRGFDNGWDGYKLSGAVGTPKLFAMEESGNYQISTSSDLNNTYLGFQAGIDLEDTLTFKSENLGLKYDGVYLVDLIENKVVDITKSGTQYAFKAESTAAPIKRFKITTEAYVKNAQDLTTQIKVFNDNDAVFVDNSSNQKGELYFYDLMGRYLKKEIFGPNSISSFPLSSVSGVYVVKAITSTEKVSKKIIVNKQSE